MRAFYYGISFWWDAYLYPAMLAVAVILWLLMKWWIKRNSNRQ